MGSNAEHVRTYYKRNRQSVLVRKALRRASVSGSMPSARSVQENGIPMLALLVAFADWCAKGASDEKLKKQGEKYQKLRVRFPVSLDRLGPDERQALVYLNRRFGGL